MFGTSYSPSIRPPVVYLGLNDCSLSIPFAVSFIESLSPKTSPTISLRVISFPKGTTVSPNLTAEEANFPSMASGTAAAISFISPAAG